MKNNKNIIIGTLLVVILIMAVGYSAFATQLTLNGTAEIIGNWDIRITSITAQDVSQNCDPGEPQFTNTTVTFNAKLVKPGDYITYLVMIENYGTFDATLQNFKFTPEEKGSSAIIYTTSEPNNLLPAGEQTCFLLKVMYDENSKEVPEVKTRTITGIIEYVQK